MHGYSGLLAVGYLLAAGLVTAAPARADTTVGTYSQENCFPFGCFGSISGAGSIYQQVYAASAFSGPITIDTLRFNGVGTAIEETATYTLSFFLAANGVNALSTASAAANRGTLLSTFGTFTLGGAAPQRPLTLSGSEFSYDPTRGNLLLQIVVDSLTVRALNNNATFQTAGFQPSTSRVTFGASGTGGTALNLGIVTTFADAPTAAVPEPASWALMIGGFGMVGGAVRRHNRGRTSASFG